MSFTLYFGNQEGGIGKWELPNRFRLQDNQGNQLIRSPPLPNHIVVGIFRAIQSNRLT